MRQTRKTRRAKARQALKLAEIRQALIAAGCDTTAKQAAVLGVGRAPLGHCFTLDQATSPSAIVIKASFHRGTFRRVAATKFENISMRRSAACIGMLRLTPALGDKLLTRTANIYARTPAFLGTKLN